MVNVHSGYLFKENIFPQDSFWKKKTRKCYRKRCGGFSNNVKTGNFRRRTLRRLTKLAVTNYSFSQELNKVQI